MRRVAARALGALGLAVVALAGTGSAAVAGSVGAPAQPGPDIALVDQTAWVHAGESFETRVRVAGAPAGATVDMVVHEPVETRRAFRRTLEGELGDERFTLPEQAVATGPDGTMSVGFSPGETRTRLPSRGVYPVEVRVLSAGGETLDTVVTYLSFLNAATPEYTPLDVAVLVDIAAAPALQPDGGTILPADTLARVSERIQVLDETAGVPLTLAPRPETIEGLAHADLAGAGAIEQLQEAARRHPVFARPFVDVDLVALERAGLLPEANAQADGGANVVRNRLGVEPTGGMWLSGDNFGTDAARLIVELGIDRLVVPPSVVEGGLADDSGDEGSSGDDASTDTADDGSGGDGSGDAAGTTVPLAPVTLGEGGPWAMVTDPDLAEHLVGGDMAAAHRFVAELAITWLEAPANPRGIVVHLPPDADIDPDVVATALGALGDGQAARAVPVDQVFQDVPPLEEGPTSVPLAAYEPTDSLTSISAGLRSVRSRVAGVGALLGDPGVTTDLEQSLLLSTGTETPTEARAAYIERADAVLGLVDGAVSLPEEFRITLTSRSSTIPVQITNNSNQELEVRVILDSDQLEFPEGDVLTPTLDASTTTRIEVPVRARTSGAFSLDITVTSPDGSLVLDTTRFDVRSTAISGVGLVLSAGACLFLAVWWAKHWRSARRSRHLMPAGAVAGSGGVGGAPSGATDAAGDDPAAGADPPGPGRTGGPRGPGGPGSAGGPGASPGEPYRPAHMARQRSRSG